MSESIPENDVIISKNVKDSSYPTADNAAGSPNVRRKKKKSGAFGIFKAALFMMRKRRGEKSGAKPVLAKQDSTAANNTNANWTKLVGSVRPLHLQETSHSPPPIAVAIAEEIRDMIPPASPSVASTSSGTMSKYASAASLLDLDNSSDDEEEEDPDEVFDALTGDEMIDAKAEEFIAQFYKQIQLQRTARTPRHHHSREI